MRTERVEIPVRQWVPIPAERIAPRDVPQAPAELTWGELLQLTGALYGLVEAYELDRKQLRDINEQRSPQPE